MICSFIRSHEPLSLATGVHLIAVPGCNVSDNTIYANDLPMNYYAVHGLIVKYVVHESCDETQVQSIRYG